MENKPAHLSIYEYSEELFNKFGDKKKNAEDQKETRRTVRRATGHKNTQTQIRRGTATHVAVQKHNLLQEKLKNKLIAEYGKENVFLEKNFVDIKVIQSDKIYLYEIKSSAYASDCIKEALGQILSYAHRDSDKKPKQLIIAGQYPPNGDEIEFINYVKENLNLNFSYQHIDLE